MSTRVRRIDFYPADFLTGVAGMSAELIGVYWVICSLLYQTGGSIALDDPRLKTLCGVNYRRLPKVLGELVERGKLTTTETGLADDLHGTCTRLATNRRVSSELARAEQRVSKAKAAREQLTVVSSDINDISKSKPKFPDAAEIPSRAFIQQPSVISHQSETEKARVAALGIEFAEWWASYPCKDSKKAAEKAYATARRKASPEQLLIGVSRYRDTKPASQSWAHGASWLNKERWNDESLQVQRRYDNDPNYRNLL